MSLLHLQDASLTFGLRPILDGVNLVIGANERIGLLGRNGEGKSTLLKVFTGEQTLDSGDIRRRQGLRIAHLGQEIDPDSGQSVLDVVLGGLGHQGRLIAEYHAVARKAAEGGSQALRQLESVQQAIDAADAWSMERQAQAVITRMGLDGDAPYGPLSGGMKRRVLLAKTLANDPEILLLDEPTNHLDLDAIAWLEEFLDKFQGTLVFITHDRRFLRRLSTRILELDRGRLFDWSCGYEMFLERKQALLEAEDTANAKFDKRLAEEEVWIRKGIKARRTRNEGRVRALKEMREERRQRLSRAGTANIQIQEGRGSGTLVAEAIGADFAYGGKPVIKNLNAVIHRGDRVGIIGPNGAGKTTLVRLLLGSLQPQAGRVRTGTNLDVAYFDQHRSQLDDTKTVIDNIGDGRDVVTVNGKDKHVLSYLQDFLFTPERARSPISVLSGGERNRLLLAKLFTRPSNLLVLDEPTNDLDLETLELLEEVVAEYKGTILVVSHDRDFINHVVTQCLVLKGDGEVHEFVGDYDDWLRHVTQMEALGAKADSPAEASVKPKSRPNKLSYKETRELEALPAEIERLEAERDEAAARMSLPDHFRQPPEVVRQAQADLEALELAIQTAYARWETLESLREAYEKA